MKPVIDMDTMLDRMAELIVKRGLSQDSLATMVGLPQGRISKWKKGQGEPTARQLWLIAQALSVPVDYFLSPEASEASGPRGDRSADIDLIWGIVRELGIPTAKARLLMHRPGQDIDQGTPTTVHGRRHEDEPSAGRQSRSV